MKRWILMLAAGAMMLPSYAEENDAVNQSTNTPSAEVTSAEDNPSPERDSGDRRSKFKKRQLKLMEKALNELGVTEEQRQQIIALQKVHMEKMKENWKRMDAARCELSRLQDMGASMEELDVAIQEVSDAQNERLQILVHNRKEMEKILGKEKNDRLMQMAHEYFRKHGRRPGAGMPPRPSPPPIPGENQSTNQTPPAPPVVEPGSNGSPPVP